MSIDHQAETARPNQVRVERVPLSSRQREWIDAAWALVDEEKALKLDVDLTNIWSYSGFERELAEFVVDRFERVGLDTFYQAIDPTSGNAIGRIRGDRTGATLMLVAPCDSHFTGRQEDDGLQWGDPMRRDNLIPAVVEGKTVIGLTSSNPKSLCAAIVLAAEALATVGVQLNGTLITGIAAGGAPARSAPNEERNNISLGAGVKHMLAHGIVGDFALYHKPGYHVGWEDVGLNQFRIRIKGDPSYMARPPYAVVTHAANVALAFNKWAKEEYPKQAQGLFSPGASLNVIQVGRPDKPNWSSAIAELYCDIRSLPGSLPIRTRYLLDEVMERICAANPGIDAEWEMVASMPGGRTEPTNWIVQSAIRGAQAVDGDTSEMYTGRNAGQTEMGYMQMLGIPSAKISGSPSGQAVNPEMPEDLTRGFTMAGAYAPNIVKAAQVMIYAAVDTLTRSREEVGLQY